MKKYISAILMTVVFIIGGAYLYLHRSQLSILENIGGLDLALIFILTLLFFYVTGYTFARILLLMNVRLSAVEILGMSILTNFGNYLGPIRPGAAIKAVYLKKYKGVVYSNFASIFAANGFLALFMMGGVGILLLYFMSINNIHTPRHLYFICAGLVLVSILPFICKLPNLTGQHKIIIVLRSAIEGFKQIRSKKIGLIMVCITFLGQFIVAALINEAVYASIGVPIGFLLAMAIGVFTSIANLFTLTPNNLGVQEAVIAYVFTLSGSDFATGLIGATLARLVHMLITFILAPLFTHHLIKPA